MKKALALSAFALVMALPLVSSASSITNSFVGSTTGTAQLNSAGDTITFEVTIDLNSGQAYTAMLFTLSGDGAAAVGSASPAWAGVANTVSSWAWHYTVGAGATGSFKVNMGAGGGAARITPFAPPAPAPDAVTGTYGFLGNAVGAGPASMVGTVTITATANGVYQGGAYLQPGVGVFGNTTITDTVSINGGAFTVGVVPEPGTALLMMLGLGGLGVMGRSNRK